jgi:hypothetical protein
MIESAEVKRLIALLRAGKTATGLELAQAIESAGWDELAPLAERARALNRTAREELDSAIELEPDRKVAEMRSRLIAISDLLDFELSGWLLRLHETIDFHIETLEARVPRHAFAPASIIAAEAVPIFIDYEMTVRNRFEEAQKQMYQEFTETGAELMIDLLDEIESRIAELNQQMGATICLAPAIDSVRFQKFSAVPLSVEFDPFEDARVLTAGAGFIKHVKPKWLRDFLEKIKFRHTPVAELAGAGLGHQSIQNSKRSAVRRELMTSIAEQGRRVIESVSKAITTSHRRLTIQIPTQIRRAQREAEREAERLSRHRDEWKTTVRRIFLETEQAATAVILACQTRSQA